MLSARLTKRVVFRGFIILLGFDLSRRQVSFRVSVFCNQIDILEGRADNQVQLAIAVCICSGKGETEASKGFRSNADDSLNELSVATAKEISRPRILRRCHRLIGRAYQDVRTAITGEIVRQRYG